MGNRGFPTYQDQSRTEKPMAHPGVLLDEAKAIAAGQVTIPKDVREFLGVQSGDRVLFVVDCTTVRMANVAA